MPFKVNDEVTRHQPGDALHGSLGIVLQSQNRGNEKFPEWRVQVRWHHDPLGNPILSQGWVPENRIKKVTDEKKAHTT